jgi:hypothetical protein
LNIADTNRPQPQGKSVAVNADIGVSTPGNSTGVLKCIAGTVQLAAEGFTSLAATIQRASLDPAGPLAASVVWSNVGTALSAAGVTTYTEYGVGWYRVNATTLTGTGNMVLSATNA